MISWVGGVPSPSWAWSVGQALGPRSIPRPPGAVAGGCAALGGVRIGTHRRGHRGPELFFVPRRIPSVVAIRTRTATAWWSVGTAVGLRKAYAPAVSRDGSTQNERVVYGFSPSEDTPTLQVFWGLYSDGTLSVPQHATPTPGKLATWKPGEDIVAYVQDSAIFLSVILPFEPPQAYPFHSGGVNTAPSWGPFGAKTLAFLHGGAGGPYTDLISPPWGPRTRDRPHRPQRSAFRGLGRSCSSARWRSRIIPGTPRS
jgi:hypothetical protein